MLIDPQEDFIKMKTQAPYLQNSDKALTSKMNDTILSKFKPEPTERKGLYQEETNNIINYVTKIRILMLKIIIINFMMLLKLKVNLVYKIKEALKILENKIMRIIIMKMIKVNSM